MTLEEATEALTLIQDQLDRVEWSADTATNIAEILRRFGFPVREVDDLAAGE